MRIQVTATDRVNPGMTHFVLNVPRGTHGWESFPMIRREEAPVLSHQMEADSSIVQDLRARGYLVDILDDSPSDNGDESVTLSSDEAMKAAVEALAADLEEE